ncbi:MAG: CPBP family intramembrane metalloprotease [Chloroflexi bacterium]|nr:CPBP family intramembrane metalloprotease [Chloroflexota bacterium]
MGAPFQIKAGISRGERVRITTPTRYFLFSLPILLLFSTAFVFVSLSQRFSKELSYVVGFLFYDGFWCLMIPYLILGKDNFLSVFKEDTSLFRKENWWLVLLLLSTTIGAFGMLLRHNIANTPRMLIVTSIPVAIITGTCEEILWRGLYTKVFPKQVVSGLIYPTIGFAVWHLSPQLIYPATMPGGMFAFAGLTFFLGLCYGLVAYKTGSCRWTAISHSLNGVLDFGGALAPAVLALIFSSALR